MASDTPMPAKLCTASCEAPTADGVFLCRAHENELSDALRTVPGLAEDLDVTITRQSRTAGQKHGARSSTTPLPWNEHASSCRIELNAILNAWAYETSQIGEHPSDPLSAVHASDTAILALWLRSHSSFAVRHDQAGDMYGEILDAITQATRAVDLPPDRKFIGVCGHHPDDWPKACKEDLYALPRQHKVICRGCTHEHDADARRAELLSAVEDQAATTGVLAGLLSGLGQPIGASTIRKYAVDHSLRVISRDRNGRPRYLVRDVLDAFLKREPRDAAA